MLPRIQLKCNVLLLLLSILTRDEDMEEEELRLATAVNCFVQEVGRASDLREMIDDGKIIRCNISIQSYNPQDQTSWRVSKPWYHWDNILYFLSNSEKQKILEPRGLFSHCNGLWLWTNLQIQVAHCSVYLSTLKEFLVFPFLFSI